MSVQIFREIENELKYQKTLNWKDDKNTGGAFCGYITNYATRWLLPLSFDPKKYNFRTCMIKVAALAIAAIRWYDSLKNKKGADLMVPHNVTPDELKSTDCED